MPFSRNAGSIAIAFLLTTGLFTGPATAQEYNWTMTSYVSKESGTWNNYMQRFIDAVHLFTNDRVKIKGFSVGVLSGPFDGWDAVRKGNADICFCYPGFAVNADPANGIFAGMAGGMPMEEFMHWLLAGEGGTLLADFRRTQGLHSVVTGMGSTEIFLHAHRKVETLSDLKGMKIRTAGAWADILADLGASATVISPKDIYMALEQGLIDGTEFVTPATNIKLGLHKIAKYIVVPGIHSPAHMNEAVFRLEDWESLPEILQKQITAAGAYAGLQSALELGIADLAAVEAMQAGQNEWTVLDADAQEKIEELGRAWSMEKAEEQLASGNPWMSRVSESYWGFYDRWKKFGTYRHN